MNEPPGAREPSGDERCFFRRRTTGDLQQEGRRLLEEARAARPEEAGAPAGEAPPLPPEKREAPGLSRWALERELARGRRLEDEVLSIQDQERARLARDLHDGISQNLVAVALMLEMHLRLLPESGPDSRPRQSGEKLSELLDQTIQEMRAISHGLSGLEAGARGEKFRAALHDLAERVNASGNVRCVVVCPERPALGETNAAPLYRLVQEAVRIALRHGKATRVEIGLARVKGQWRLTVTDDGTGVPENRTPDGGVGLGMRSMQYRAAVVGGRLKVRRAHATGDRPGTVVSCTFP